MRRLINETNEKERLAARVLEMERIFEKSIKRNWKPLIFWVVVMTATVSFTVAFAIFNAVKS